jgi:hypothetical protein
MKILAIDLGKFKSVACLFDTTTNQATYETIPMFQSAIENLLHQSQAEQVVIETCTNSGWVYDICQTQGYRVLVANPNQEAWQWRNEQSTTPNCGSVQRDAIPLHRHLYQSTSLPARCCLWFTRNYYRRAGIALLCFPTSRGATDSNIETRHRRIRHRCQGESSQK